jgi:ribosomal protein S18 acetylase RimI-like enzyme
LECELRDSFVTRGDAVPAQDPAVRPAALADAHAIGALAARAWRAAYAGLLTSDILTRLDADEQGDEWAGYLSELPTHDRVWVVEPTGVVCGFARTGPCPDADLPAGAGEVHGLYLDPDRIGTGLGRRLYGHAVADLAERGHDPIVVWHFAENRRAARFYERAGFVLDGARRPSGFGIPEVRRRRPG